MIQANLGNVRGARCAAIRVLGKKSDGEIVRKPCYYRSATSYVLMEVVRSVGTALRAAIAQALIFHIETLSHGWCLERPAFVSLL
jgi:hypothetical protein